MFIVFVIPFKARATSKNWEADCELLQNTLGSIDCQDSTNHRSIVICNEMPSLSRSFERVEFVPTERTITGTVDEKAAQADKVAKGFLGLRHAARYSPRCVMFLDADDLLHRSIVSYIESQPDYDAFLINLGYVHRLGNSWMQQTRRFHQACASSMVYPFRSSWLDSEPGSKSVYERIVKNHNQRFEKDLESLGIKVLRVPFFGAVYTQGIEGHMRGMKSRTRRPAGVRRALKRRVEKLVRSSLGPQPIDVTIRSGFPTICTDLAARNHQAIPQRRDEECSSDLSKTALQPIKVTMARCIRLSIRRRLRLG